MNHSYHLSAQLPLSLNLRDDAIFDNYFVGKNAPVIVALQSTLAGAGEQFIYLVGEQGVGRSHLLQACCHVASEKNTSVFYLDLSEHVTFSPAILEGIEQLDLVCIDNIDSVVGDRDWEEALFHFYNRARENQIRLLVSARHAPKQLNWLLPDLQSRLSWGLVLKVSGLTDDEKIKALQMRANNRGLMLTDEVGKYLIRRYPRNMQVLFSVLEKLDSASMAAKRRLTIPFVKTVVDA